MINGGRGQCAYARSGCASVSLDFSREKLGHLFLSTGLSKTCPDCLKIIKNQKLLNVRKV
jgi:hypothetical protein